MVLLIKWAFLSLKLWLITFLSVQMNIIYRVFRDELHGCDFRKDQTCGSSRFQQITTSEISVRSLKKERWLKCECQAVRQDKKPRLSATKAPLYEHQWAQGAVWFVLQANFWATHWNCEAVLKALQVWDVTWKEPRLPCWTVIYCLFGLKTAAVCLKMP